LSRTEARSEQFASITRHCIARSTPMRLVADKTPIEGKLQGHARPHLPPATAFAPSLWKAPIALPAISRFSSPDTTSSRTSACRCAGAVFWPQRAPRLRKIAQAGSPRAGQGIPEPSERSQVSAEQWAECDVADDRIGSSHDRLSDHLPSRRGVGKARQCVPHSRRCAMASLAS
jgi:hypothetical protein